MHYCPYIIVDHDTSLADGLSAIGSVWVTQQMGVSSIASPKLEAGAEVAGTATVKDRKIAEGHVRLGHLASAHI